MKKYFAKKLLLVFSIIFSISTIIFSNSAFADAFEDLGAYSSKGLEQGSKGFANGAFVESICDIFGLLGGELGGFLTAATLFVALVLAVVGGLGQARAAVIVGVAAFSISTIVSLYFGTFSCS